jgi:hypothetical protein
MLSSKNFGARPALMGTDEQTRLAERIRDDRLGAWDAEAVACQIHYGKALEEGTTDEIYWSPESVEITGGRACDLLFSAFHAADAAWWLRAAGLSLRDLDRIATANESRAPATPDDPYECLECGATYDWPDMVSPGGMGCQRCN